MTEPSVMNSDYLVAFLLVCPGFACSRDPFALGAFEFTRRPDPMPGCENAIAESLEDFGLAPAAFIRVRTYILDATRHEGIRVARLYVREAVSLMAHLSMEAVSVDQLRDAGYTFDLRRSHAQPLRPIDHSPRRPTGFVAKIDEIGHHPDLVLNTLLSVSPDTYGELGQAVRRSTHWSELARHADDSGERLMLRWMCCETLARVGVDEDISPKLLSLLGFPSGKCGEKLPQRERAAIGAVPGYREWRRRLVMLLDKARDMRNSIVHAGFREIELRSKLTSEDWVVLNRAMTLVIPRLQALAFNALELRITSVERMWDDFGTCVLRHREIPLASELEGTIIYTLDQQRSPFDDL